MTARRLTHAGFIVLLLAVAAVPLWSIYQDPAIVAVALGALVFGGAIAVAGALRRWPIWFVALVTVVGYLVVGVPLAVPSQALARVVPSLDGFRSLVTGSVTAWKRMLSVDLPLGHYEALLVPSLAVLLVAVVTGLSVALRAGTPGWAVLAPVAVLVFGIAFGSSQADLPVVAGLLMVVIALIWALRSGVGSTVTAPRVVAALLLVLLTLGAGGALVSVHPPSTSRQVLRTAFVPPFDPSHSVSPLVGFRNSVLPPGKSRDMLAVTGLPKGARVRVATLDDYDGLVFAVGDGSASASSGTFARVPSRVVRESSGRTATVRIRVEGYSGVWLPTVGDTSSIDFVGDDSDTNYYLNAETGTAAVPGGVDQGSRYTVHTVVPTTPSLSRLVGLDPGNAEQPEASALPSSLAAVVKAHTAGLTTPGSKLVAVTKWLRGGYVSDSGEGEPFSAAGHTAGRIQSLLTDTPMLGDAEQYAPALALLARQIGFPSRVVVGYAPKAGQTELAGSDLTAWVEVETADGTWFTVDPNPEVRPVPSKETKPTESIARPQTVLPPPPPQKNDTAVTLNRDGQKTKHDPGPPAWLVVLTEILRIGLPVVIVAAIVSAPLWAIAVARLLRRHHRRRADQAAKVVSGAWEEISDTISDSGYSVERASTRSEIAATVGTPEVLRLAAEAERSVFSTQVLVSDDVDRFWASTAVAKKSVRATASTRWERLRFHLTARSLVVTMRRWWDARKDNAPR